MSDRGHRTLHIYDVKAIQSERDAVEAILAKEGLSREDDVEDDTLTGLWSDDEARLDAHDEIAGALIAAMPGIAFAIWNDPKYEYLGGISLYTPELGVYSADCDADGNVVKTAHEIVTFLGRFLGEPWTKALTALGRGGAK